MVDGCHQWKVTRMISKSSSSTSSIIEYSGMSCMNFDKSWIMNYCSSLREQEENFDNLCCEPWNVTSKVHKIRTTLKRRWIFKRASGNRCLHDAGKTWPPRKAAAAAAGAAAILCQYIRGQSPTTEKKRVLREGSIWTMISGWHTWRRHYSRISSSSMSTSTPW